VPGVPATLSPVAPRDRVFWPRSAWLSARQTRRSGRFKTSAAFTLLELVLTVALMLLLAGAVILSFGALDRQYRLGEGASHLETLFRYARAQSANTGRQVRIAFVSEKPIPSESGSRTNLPPGTASTNLWVELLWEPDPVGAPGRFESLPGAEMLVDQVNELVKVQAVGQPGEISLTAGGFETPEPPLRSQTAETNTLSASDSGAKSTPPLTCYPDGSSDSRDVLLSAANGEDQRVALVTLSGISGRTRHRIFTPDEFESDPSPTNAYFQASQ